MSSGISPLAPKSYAQLPSIAGVRMACVQAGIKYTGRKDVLLMVFDEGTQIAGVFTKSKCPSAPVDWCRDKLAGGKARALLVNSGNANAFTGLKGRTSVEQSAADTARAAGCNIEEVFLASTGVIGEPLDASKFSAVLTGLAGNLDGDGWLEAASTIMTTDTYPKVSSASARIDGQPVTINGIAKGSGMIAPDMATMLSFIVTDAPIAAPVLQNLLSRDVQSTYNSVTVDSDTSTSDTVLLFATGAATGITPITDPKDRRLRGFRKALQSLMLDLSHQIVRDGEGASKFVEIQVTGATSARSARRIAFAIANSPLVKTAIAGEDANWGRVVMAVGKAGEPADRDRLAIWFGEFRVAVNGERDDGYDEDTVSAYMKGEDIVLRVDLGLGKSQGKVWTCDLTKQYVAINGDYRS